MRASKVIGALAMTLMVLSTVEEPRAQAPAANLTLIDQVSGLVRRHFYDPAVAAGVWPKAVEKYVAALPTNPSDNEVETAVDAMLAALGASHTDRYTMDEQAYYELLDIFARRDWRDEIRSLFPGGRIAYTGIGVVTKTVEGRTFLAGVYDGGPAERAGLLVGDEIIEADGRSFDPVASFAGKTGTAVTLKIRRIEGGPVETVDVAPMPIRPNAFFLEAMRSSARVIERNGRDFGYIRIWSYARRDYHRLLIEELANGRLRNVEGLVLDLRGGWGGAQPDYAELFVGGAPITTFVDRDGDEDVATFRWRRPLVVLVDEGTRSGKEVIAYGLQRQGLTLVGQRTAGALLGGRGFLLDDGSLLVLAVTDVRVEGKRLEGNGVIPNRLVPFNLPYARGRDPQLDAALRELADET